jgi:hypothetical protein
MRDAPINAMAGRNSIGKLKSFSIPKYGIELAYKECIKYVFGDENLSLVLEKYPVPKIHQDDLATVKRTTKRYVYGIISVFSPSKSMHLCAFSVNNGKVRCYFSIRKLGLEKAWADAVAYRYSYFDPLPGDKPELPLEFWSLIKTKYDTRVN